MSNEVRLAEQIATAVFTKLKLNGLYDVTVRRYASPCPMPWIEIEYTKIGHDPTTHGFCISLPESRYTCENKEERSVIAQYIYKTVAIMVGKMEPK